MFERLVHKIATTVWKEKVQKVFDELGNYLSDHLKKFLEYELRLINIYKRPKNQLT